jgi:fatty acid desaturase
MSSSPITVRPDLLRELHRPRARHGPRAAIFLALYGATALAAWRVTSAWHSWAAYLACAPLYLLAAASLHGVSLFTHEAVHGTLSRNRTLNAVGGAICAWPVLQNYSAYRVLHLAHHDQLGRAGHRSAHPASPVRAGPVSYVPCEVLPFRGSTPAAGGDSSALRTTMGEASSVADAAVLH